MIEILAVFRSRSQAADCNSRMKAAGINCLLVNTPKEAGVGCGLSVKIPQNSLPRARMVIKMANYSAFYGFYSQKNVYGRNFFSKL